MTELQTAPYRSVPEYIYGCTREIWEDRGIGAKLARYYAPDCLVRAPSGLTRSMAGVAGDTLATLHQFPDRQLIGEDVIWKPTGGDGFLSSHRLLSVMHHTGDGRWGSAGGKLVKSRIIADCWVTGGVITEEWLVRDGAAFAAALGTTPEAMAREQLAADRAAGRDPAIFTDADEVIAAYRPALADDPAGAFVAETWQAIWGDKAPAALRERYFEGTELTGPGGVRANGQGEIDAFVIGMLASFPDARLTLYESTVLREAEAPVRVALRWSLDGTHRGWGRFGAPTGAPVHVMAMSHVHVRDSRIVAEWTLWDEVAIWTQIVAPR